MTLPANWSTVEVRVGPYRGSDGAIVQGQVEFSPRPNRLTSGGTMIVQRKTIAKLDANGEGVVDLPVNDDPDVSPTGWTWFVKERFQGGDSYDITVSTADVAAGVDLSERAPEPIVAFGDFRNTFQREMSEVLDDAEDARAAAELARQAAEDLVVSDLGTTDGQTRALIEAEGSQTAQALSVSIAEGVEASALPGGSVVGQAKQIEGGVFPKPIRAPHLVVDEVYPNDHVPRSIVWATQAGLMIATGSDQGGADRSLWKSTDYGRTWAYVSTPSNQITQSTFLVLTATGTFLAFSGAAIWRSTDYGVTWANVHTLRTNTTIMGMNSWTEDGNGHVFYGEYQTVDTFTEIRVYRSTDDGATFSVFHTFPGPATTEASRIRHVHAMQGDLFEDRRLYVTTGDSEPNAGIYRMNASGTALEPVVTNARLASLGTTLARSIGLAFFSTHLAWGVDATESPYLIRMARTQIGLASPAAEIVYRLNGTAWWTIRASDDSTRWLVSASKEGATAIDNVIHLYAVEGAGSVVYEVGSLPQNSASGAGAVAAVGRPEIHGDRLWLATYNTNREGGLPARYQLGARLAYGVAPLSLSAPPRTPPVIAWQTQGTGYVPAMPANDVHEFGGTRSGALRRKFLIHDYVIRRVVGAQVATLVVYNLGTSTAIWSSEQTGTMSSKRASTPVRDGDPSIVEIDVPASSALEFRLVASGTGGFEGYASITYGWAEV